MATTSHKFLTSLSFFFFLITTTIQSNNPCKFERIFIIVLENQAYENILDDQLYQYYASQGMNLSKYYGVAHPSQPNYWAMVSGKTWFFDNDNHDIDGTHLGQLFDQKNITWKTYQESWPGNCFSGTSYSTYYRKHNPFISFNDVRADTDRCNQHIVDASELDRDISENTLPQFSFYTPDINNGGHNTNFTFAIRWVDSFLKPKLNQPNFSEGTLVVITFDEDDYNHDNHVFAVLLGPMVPKGSVDPSRYDHYSLFKTIADRWDLAIETSSAPSFTCDGFISNQSPTPTEITPTVTEITPTATEITPTDPPSETLGVLFYAGSDSDVLVPIILVIFSLLACFAISILYGVWRFR